MTPEFPEYNSGRGVDDVAAKQIVTWLESELLADRFSWSALHLIGSNASHLAKQYAPQDGSYERRKKPRKAETMAPRYEHDYPPTMRPRRAKPQGRPLQGEILGPEPKPTPRIRVEVTHRYQPRRHSAPPPWVVALLIIGVPMRMAPLGTVIAIVMGAILITSHPMIGVVIGGTITLVIIIAIRERWKGREF
jgi:hypothetical protein